MSIDTTRVAVNWGGTTKHVVNPEETAARGYGKAACSLSSHVFEPGEMNLPDHLKRLGAMGDVKWCKRCAKKFDLQDELGEQPTPSNALDRVRDLAAQWENATDLGTGNPNIVARAFAHELRLALGEQA